MFSFTKKDIAQKRVRELENIIDSISAPMFITDSDLKIIRINDAALQAAGYKREEVVDKMTCAELAKTPLCGTNKCTLKQCMSTRQPIMGETVMTTRSGKKVPISAACSPLIDETGKSLWRNGSDYRPHGSGSPSRTDRKTAH